MTYYYLGEDPRLITLANCVVSGEEIAFSLPADAGNATIELKASPDAERLPRPDPVKSSLFRTIVFITAVISVLAVVFRPH